MDEQRKYAILFAATILAARELNEIGSKPCPAQECAIADAIENAKRILERSMSDGPVRRNLSPWETAIAPAGERAAACVELGGVSHFKSRRIRPLCLGTK